MKRKKCPKCKENITPTSKECPSCGHELDLSENDIKSSKKKNKMFCSGIILLMLFEIIFYVLTAIFVYNFGIMNEEISLLNPAILSMLARNLLYVSGVGYIICAFVRIKKGMKEKDKIFLWYIFTAIFALSIIISGAIAYQFSYVLIGIPFILCFIIFNLIIFNKDEAVFGKLINLKIFTYFKRIKQPVKSREEAQPILKETKTYFFICLVLGIIFGVLAYIIEALYLVFLPLSFILLVGVAIFGIHWHCAIRVLIRLDNVTCSCGNMLTYYDLCDWREVSRRWENNNSGKTLYSKLYVTVDIKCKCSVCGTEKTFREILCSGKITVNDYSVNDNIISTGELIKDYMNGLIH